MGLIRRNKSGRFIGGSRLNVPGQGIYTVVRQPNDKDPIKSQLERIPRPSQTPTPSVTPTITPTPSVTPTYTPTPTPTPTQTPIDICYLSTEDLNPIIAENGDNLIVDCSEPSPTPTNTPTPTPTQSEQVIVDALLIDGGSGYLIPGDDEYLMFVDP